MRPATPHEKRQKSRHILAKTPIKASKLLEHYINVPEHTTTPGSWHCKHCLNVLTTKRTFLEHINRCHTRDVLFLCNDANCGYQCFSFISLCSHDRRFHQSRRSFSYAFRCSELIQSQPTLYEVVGFAREQEGRHLWVWEDNPCRKLPDGGRRTGVYNSQPVSHMQRPKDISCTSPLPSGQDTRGVDEACPAFEPTADFREIYHTFKQKLATL